MTNFLRAGDAYQLRPHDNKDLGQAMVLYTDDIAVPPRGPGVPNLKEDRMVDVLRAIRSDQPLPPVEVRAANVDGANYELYDGRHRYAASIVAGFPLIWVVVARSINIKRSEGTA